jgi:hypothetical protein
MEATQVNCEDYLASRLETRLDEVGERGIETINASVSGWVTRTGPSWLSSGRRRSC